MGFDHLNETELRELAKKRIDAKNEFKIGLIVYVIVNLGLFGIYAMTNYGGYPWFLWPLFGWGIGVVAHYFSMRKVLKGDSNADIDREIEKMKGL
jgi:hypothetical protein